MPLHDPNYAQSTTNRQMGSRMAQQRSQPAGGNFQAQPPSPELRTLVDGMKPQPPAPKPLVAPQSPQPRAVAKPTYGWTPEQAGSSQAAQKAAPTTDGNEFNGPPPQNYSTTTQTAPATGAPGTPVPGKPGFYYNANGGYDTYGPGAAPGQSSEWQPVTNTGNWNTDNYAAPAYTAPNPGGVMAGWDGGKWSDPNHQTPKYAVGRILSQYPPTPAGLTQAMGDIQKAYPGATQVGADKVNIPGVGIIDVLQGASQGGVAWQWGADEPGEPAAPPASPNAPPTTPAGGVAPGTTPTPAPTAPPVPAPPPAPTAPAYTPYQYNIPDITPPATPTPTASSTAPTYTAGQGPTGAPPVYEAGTAPTYTPADTADLISQLQELLANAPGVTTPGYEAGDTAQYGGTQGNATLAAALAQLQGLNPDVNTAGMKEAQKETLLAAQRANSDALLGGAAARGVGGVQKAALEAASRDQFGGDLTKAYRDIDLAGQQQSLNNRLGIAGAMSGIGQAQGASDRADFASTLEGQKLTEQLHQIETQLGLDRDSLAGQLQNQSFGQGAALTALLQNIAQGDFAANSASAGQQAQMDQAAAASGQAANAQTLQQWIAQQQANQAEAASGQSAANYGLNYDAQQLAAQNQSFQQMLQAAGLNFQGQQAQAGENQAAAQMTQQQQQFYAQLEQQAAQAAAAMGLNYAQLNQQDKQFLLNLQLQQAIAASNQNQNTWNTILGLTQ